MELTLLETSDIHGYLFPTDYQKRNQDLPFGLLKVSNVLQEERRKAQGPVLQIENGDFIQGSPLSYYAAKQLGDPKELVQGINLLSYDVGVIGNHEFNYGQAYLREALKQFDQPVLAANILNHEGLPAFGEPYVLLEKENITVAVLGLTTQYIPHWEKPSYIEGLTFQSAVECAKQYVPLLKEKADIVVVSYHGGFERDLETGKPTEPLTGENEAYQLIEEVSGIDALLTGHQHRSIATKVNGIPVVQPGEKGNYIGKITLSLSKKEHRYTVKTSSAELISVADYKIDIKSAKRLQKIHDEVENWLDQPLGKVKGDMTIRDPFEVRLKGHPYIEFIQKVQMDAAGVDISGTALFSNTGTGFNSLIKMRDILTNYIYPNTLAVLAVSGKTLREALERSAGYFQLEPSGEIGINPDFLYPKPQHYNYDMYAGIEYTIDVSRPIWHRITELKKDGKPILDTDRLEIVTNQYRAVGGGNYDMFAASEIIREINIDMTELIAEYIRKTPVLEATPNRNFHVRT